MEIATIFVSPILGDLIPKLLTYCSEEFNLVWGVKGDLEKLAQTLQKIEAVLHDAEKRQGENDKLVKIWLGELKDVAYDAVDIFDELHYKDLRHKKKNVCNVLPCLPLKPFGFDYKMALKVKDVNMKLDGITKDMKKFNFINQLGGSRTSDYDITVANGIRSETSSHINDSAAVVGRTDDRSEILALLNQDDYSVVRITGMGGMGKTTLAQLVYANPAGDNSIGDPFQVKKWVSMYGKSKPKEIFLDLLEPKPDSESSLNYIKDSLKEKLKEKKCLIVLDDVWTDQGIDINELLKDLLSMSFQGSKILMTMRSAEEIPPMTGCRYKIYHLQGLPEADCWSIIKKTAFAHGGAEATEDLINIGRKIAIKCGGLPLAAKTLGGLLYSKKKEKDWLSILDSEIWNLPTENKIIFILKLSYDHLSPEVKQCFSYCSIFPKGHIFSKNELIRMWMAERFLSSHWQANASPEDVGNEYFKILLLNSFFQDECRNGWGDTKSCGMHDLVHDLAVSTAGSESRMVKISTGSFPEGIDQSISTCRRLGLQVLRSGVSKAIPSETYKKLSTVVYYGVDNGVWAKQICNFSLLRVLSLSHSGIQKLPQSICKLKHLRYLDVKRCSRLEELPQDMRKLVGLEYLIFSNKLISKMPRKVSRLSELKKLSVFIVGEDGKGSGIEELKDLNLLGGKLIIQNLERVTDGTQANLMGKENITHLELNWDSPGCNDPSRVIKESEVINYLQPHRNLKELRIFNFGGSKLPAWMRSSASIHLPNLVSITLFECDECEHFPALGKLQFLKYLFIDGFGGVKRIGNEFCRSNEEAVSFPSLVQLHIFHYSHSEKPIRSQGSTFYFSEKLQIENRPKLSTMSKEFPSLRQLHFTIERQVDANLKSLSPRLLWGILQTLLLTGCCNFVGFLPDNDEDHQQGNLSSNNHLSKLEIFSCPSLTVLPADLRGLNSLTCLAIEECCSLQSLPDGIQYLPALETLTIGGFSENLISFPFPEASRSDGEKYFASLRVLKICGWPTLRAELPGQLQLLTSLQSFTIRSFPCLSSLPEWFGALSSLQILGIENCSRLKCLPSDEQMQRLTSLEILNIGNCPLLLERCQSPNEEWHKIAHLKKVNGSSPSMLDHIPRDADMNLELVARRRSGIFSNQNKEKRWIDSSGRNCFMLFPRSFNIAWEHDARYWKWLSITEPSAAVSKDAEIIEVPELVSVCRLDVFGALDMSKLTPGVNYEVVFIVMLREGSYGWDAPVNLCLVLPDGQRLVQKVVLKTKPVSQWIEIHIGDFKTPQQQPGGDQEKQVKFNLSGQEALFWKSGLVIEGAVVRPEKQ